MKQFLFFCILILLVANAFAANTNVYDNVLIRNNFQFTGGTPGVNKVLTSDATGKYTPQSLISLDATILTNVALSGAPFLVASGQGTHTITLTGVGTVITNNSSPTFVATTVTTLNGMDPANFVTNISSSSLTVTAQGTHTINIEGPSTANNVTNITSHVAWLTFTNTAGDWHLTTNTTKILFQNLPNVILTNLASSADSSITWTGQGTRIMTPVLAGFVATNNSTVTFSAITNNGSEVLKAGLFIHRVATATNYTDSITDHMVSYIGTTATQVTNFLPAISTTITNGFWLVVKDGQMRAMTTNIVIFPNGTDTINLSTNFYINANGGSVDLIVDGANKNWEIK